jgi:hypothetical protein
VSEMPPEAPETELDLGLPPKDAPEAASVEPWPPRGEVSWGLLRELAQRPHPLLKPGGASGDTSDLHYSVVEVLHEALTVHHLLDMAGVPQGYSVDTTSIDCRTLIAIIGIGNLRERLDRISGWHARETGPGGTVGDFCTECGHRWPCDSRRMADGTYVDEPAEAGQ